VLLELMFVNNAIVAYGCFYEPAGCFSDAIDLYETKYLK
jgi:hypothetical protein